MTRKLFLRSVSSGLLSGRVPFRFRIFYSSRLRRPHRIENRLSEERISPEKIETTLLKIEPSLKEKIKSYEIKKKRIDFHLTYPQYDEVFAILRSKIPQIENELALKGVQIKPLLDYITCLIRIWGFKENSTDQFISTTLFDTCKVPTETLLKLEKRTVAGGKMFVILKYSTIPEYFYGLLMREIRKNRNLIEKKLDEKDKTFSLRCDLGKILSFEFKWDFPTPWKPFQTPCSLCLFLLKKKWTTTTPPLTL